jgi:hypothetical protein
MATSERAFCWDCDAPMILSLLEQDKPGFDLRSFACPMCRDRKHRRPRLIGITVT